MARFIAMYSAPSDPEAFDQHYRDIHIPLANQLPGLRRYTLSKNARLIRGQEPWYLIAELEWDDIDALRAAFDSPQGRATAADVANLTQYANTVSMIYELHDVGPTPPVD